MMSQTNQVIDTSQQESLKPLELPTLPQVPTTTTISVAGSISSKAEIRPAELIGNVPSLGTLRQEQTKDILQSDIATWQQIFENCNLLKGRRLDDNRPRPSYYKVFQFKQNVKSIHLNKYNEVKVEGYVANNERHHVFIRNKLTKTDGRFQCPFLSSIAENFIDQRSIQNTETKILYTTCVWNILRAEIILFDEYSEEDQCYLEPTPEFQSAVERIFSLPEEEQYSYLCKVFAQYGQVYPASVMLGGQLSNTHIQSVSVNIDENEHRNNVVAAFSAALHSKFGTLGRLGGGFDTAHSRTNQNVTQYAQNIYEVTGGRTVLGQNPSEWCPTTDDSSLWDVIEYGELIPVYKVLNKNLQKNITEIISRQKALLSLSSEVHLSRRSLKIWNIPATIKDHPNYIEAIFDLGCISTELLHSKFNVPCCLLQQNVSRITVNQLRQYIDTIKQTDVRTIFNEGIELLVHSQLHGQIRENHRFQYEGNAIVSVETSFDQSDFVRDPDHGPMVTITYGKCFCRREKDLYYLTFACGSFTTPLEHPLCHYWKMHSGIAIFQYLGNATYLKRLNELWILRTTLILINHVHTYLQLNWSDRIDLVEIDDEIDWNRFRNKDYDMIFKMSN